MNKINYALQYSLVSARKKYIQHIIIFKMTNLLAFVNQGYKQLSNTSMSSLQSVLTWNTTFVSNTNWSCIKNKFDTSVIILRSNFCSNRSSKTNAKTSVYCFTYGAFCARIVAPPNRDIRLLISLLAIYKNSLLTNNCQWHHSSTFLPTSNCQGQGYN